MDALTKPVLFKSYFIKSKLKCNYLFITLTGGIETLRPQLKERGTENDEQVNKRMKTAETELKFLDNNKNFLIKF